MQVFKNKAFTKWATKEGITDAVLQSAVAEMERGLVGVDLGGNVFKNVLRWAIEVRAVGYERC